MGAHLQEDRLAVVRGARAARDLDPADRPALVRPVRQRDRLDERRVALRQARQLGLVVGERPVRRPAARQAGLRRGGGVARVGLAVAPRLGGEIGDAHAVAEAGLAQTARVVGAVQHDLDAPGAAVLGQVEAQALQAVLRRVVRGRHLDDLDPVARRALGSGGRRAACQQRGRGDKRRDADVEQFPSRRIAICGTGRRPPPRPPRAADVRSGAVPDHIRAAAARAVGTGCRPSD
jgi:hypothetical protein